MDFSLSYWRSMSLDPRYLWQNPWRIFIMAHLVLYWVGFNFGVKDLPVICASCHAVKAFCFSHRLYIYCSVFPSSRWIPCEQFPHSRAVVAPLKHHCRYQVPTVTTFAPFPMFNFLSFLFVVPLLLLLVHFRPLKCISPVQGLARPCPVAQLHSVCFLQVRVKNRWWCRDKIFRYSPAQSFLHKITKRWRQCLVIIKEYLATIFSIPTLLFSLTSTIITSPIPIMSWISGIIFNDGMFIGLCLEGFLYGKIYGLCVSNCTLSNQVQLLFPM